MTAGLLAERGHLNTWLGRDHSFPGETIKTSLDSGLDISWLTHVPGRQGLNSCFYIGNYKFVLLR